MLSYSAAYLEVFGRKFYVFITKTERSKKVYEASYLALSYLYWKQNEDPVSIPEYTERRSKTVV